MKPSLKFYNFAVILIFSTLTSGVMPIKGTNNTKPDLRSLSKVTPLQRAFAHNDYQHDRPLLEALELGYTFIEADVHLIDNELHVSHYYPFIRPAERTLSNLYLEPLFQIYKNNKGRIFTEQQAPVVLMIDIKTESESTYSKIKHTIQPYLKMLSNWTNEKESPGAITIIISGNRPIESIQSEEMRYVQIDGRFEDIKHQYPNALMPIISDNYNKLFKYAFFNKKFNQNKQKKLQRISQQIHQQQKKLRLWNTPENEQTWALLLQNGVDIINTDQLHQLQKFLASQSF